MTAPFHVDKTHGAVFTAVIDELRGKNVAVSQRYAVLENFLVYDGETIAGLDVEHEVDVVLENLGEIESDAVGEFCVRSCLEQGVLDRRTGSSCADFERILEDVTAEAVGVAGHFQCLAVRQLAFESDELAAAMHEAQQFAGLQSIDLAAKLGQIPQARKVAEVQFEAAKELVHRVVAADDHLDGRETEAGLLCARRGLARRSGRRLG